MKKEKDLYQISLKILLKNQHDEILILKADDHGSYAGYFDLPGGRIDTDEFETNVAEIIHREIQEEVGDIKYRLERAPVAIGRHRIPANLTSSGKEIRVLYVFFVATYLKGELKISEEHTGLQWADLKTVVLNDYFTSGILEGIKMYLQR